MNFLLLPGSKRCDTVKLTKAPHYTGLFTLVVAILKLWADSFAAKLKNRFYSL
jgi:hypothetical protein